MVTFTPYEPLHDRIRNAHLGPCHGGHCMCFRTHHGVYGEENIHGGNQTYAG